PVPEPVSEAATHLETPSLPPRAGARSSKPKRVAPRSRWTDRVTKDKRILAAVAVAAGRPVGRPRRPLSAPKDERPAPRQGTSHTDSGPIPPKDEPPASPQETLAANSRPVPPATAGGAEIRRASLVIESPKQGATVGMREELTGRMEAEGWPVIFVQAL